jgi:hypothetical protein
MFKSALIGTAPFDQSKLTGLKVLGSSTEAIRVILGVSQHQVAVTTERTTNLARDMIMIKVLRESSADPACPPHPLVVLLDGYAVIIADVARTYEVGMIRQPLALIRVQTVTVRRIAGTTLTPTSIDLITSKRAILTPPVGRAPLTP